MFLIPIMLSYGLFSMSGLFMIWSKKKEVVNVSLPQGVSVVIAVRDEVKSVGKLLDQIFNNKWPKGLEVIVVDDGSTDGTRELLDARSRKEQRLVVLSNEGAGKKAAVVQGVQSANYEILLQTDGDCELGSYWIVSMVNRLIDGNHKLIVGPVYPIITSKVLNPFIRLEWLGIQFLTAFLCRLKQPSIANGANIAFYRKDYLQFSESRLGEKYASGDDVFFLKYISKLGKVAFNLNAAAIVRTEMPGTFTGAINQRVRWASKSNQSANILSYLFTTIVAAANFAWVAGLVFVLNDYHALPFFMIVVGWKLISDVVICWNMARFYGDVSSLKWLPVMFFISPFYMLFGLLLSFKKKYEWKGRKLR